MNEPRNDGSEWVPYQPPPPSGKERVWMFIRRISFPVVLLLFVGGLGALLYLSPDMDEARAAMRDFLGMETPRNADSAARVVPSTADRSASARSTSSADLDSIIGSEEDERGGGLGTGYANLSVFSEPSGATVLIDNDSIGVTPLNRHELRSGVYIITVQMDGHFPADTVAILRNDEAPVYSVALNSRSGQAGGERPALADRPAGSATGNTGSSASGSSAASGTNNDAAQQQQTSPPPQPEPEASAPSTGTLQFTSEPEGARVELDGEFVGTTPLTLNAVAVGTREVTFTRSGYDTSRTQVTLDPEEEREVEAVLNQLMGQLRVLVQPWGSIYIDGQLYERNADVWFETSLPIGEHEIAGVHPALGRQTRTVSLDAGEQMSVTIDLRNPPPDDAQEDASDEETSADSNRRDRF